MRWPSRRAILEGQPRGLLRRRHRGHHHHHGARPEGAAVGRPRRARQALAFVRALPRQLRLRRDLLDQSPQPADGGASLAVRLIWANAALLFCLSLMPFTTAYVGDTRLAAFPTMVYGALQFACAPGLQLGRCDGRRRSATTAILWRGSGRDARRTSPRSSSTPWELRWLSSARSRRSSSLSLSRSPIFAPGLVAEAARRRKAR